MPPQIVRLPDGQNFTVTPVFAGLFFKSHELSTNAQAFPIGWTVVLHTEDDAQVSDGRPSPGSDESDDDSLGMLGLRADDGQDKQRIGHDGYSSAASRAHVHSFTRPTLCHDSLFISSLSTPSTGEFKPVHSPTRQMAMILWITLYWYFHQPTPSPYTMPATEASQKTPPEGRPRGDWRIKIRRDGVLRGRTILPKLERMGIIASDDSAVGMNLDDSGPSSPWDSMFVSRHMFWQLPGRLFLFTLQPATGRGHHQHQNSGGSNNGGSGNERCSPFPGSSASSRPTSPYQTTPFSGGHTATTAGSSTGFSSLHAHSASQYGSDLPGSPLPSTPLTAAPPFPIGPFFSTSHLPTFYPPAPLQYVMSDSGVRHPLRPRPPRMGEVFYTRFISSVGQYLSFRVASPSSNPVPYLGPVGPDPPPNKEAKRLGTMNDTDLIHSWMSKPRVSRFWGEFYPDFLRESLQKKHCFPAIGLWDGVPFGYFEIYWVKEDILGRYLSGGSHQVGDWDRGFHVFIGEDWARGRVSTWLTSLMHWALVQEMRSSGLWMEPRVDNERFHKHITDAGFSEEGEVAFPHKQSKVMHFRRENWQGPAL